MTNQALQPSQDPRFCLLRDFILRDESGGNYNATSGSASGEAGDLSQRDINGIYALQRFLLQEHRPSSAVGAWQLLQRTLNGLVTAQQVPLSTKFTPEFQDQCGLWLLQDRGWERWLAGTLNDQMFAHALSCEWESLPDPLNSGMSHYGPKTKRTLAEVQAQLAQLKGEGR